MSDTPLEQIAGLREVPASRTVFRLVNVLHAPPGRRLPNDAFAHSSDDKEEAKRRGWPHPLASVFDSSWTTVTQAVRIRRSDKALRAFALSIHGLKGAALKVKHRPLKVLSDPLGRREGPGRRGHCGLEGLHRVSGEPRQSRKLLLDELDQICEEWSDEDAKHTPLVRAVNAFDGVVFSVCFAWRAPQAQRAEPKKPGSED